MLAFNFRIIETADGNQVIDKSIITPFDRLTPKKMIEYMEVEKTLYYMERMNRRQVVEKQKNLLYKLACLCGIIR